MGLWPREVFPCHAMDLSTFLQAAIPTSEDDEICVLGYWASSATPWASPAVRSQLEGIELSFVNADESSESYTDLAQWTSVEGGGWLEPSMWGAADVDGAWLDAEVWQNISEVASDSDGFVDCEGLRTPDEYFGVPGAALKISERDDDGVFDIPSHLSGPFESEGLSTPEEYFFSDPLM